MTVTDFEKISPAINGIGRIVQYRNSKCLQDPDNFSLSDAEQNEVICVFDGQISEGRPHGFGRAVYAESLRVYSGYMKNGAQHRVGRGIQISNHGT